jgi:hypothetical protein
MSVKMLAFTGVYFSESGLFNALWPIQAGFFVSPPPSVPVCVKRLAALAAAVARDPLSMASFIREPLCRRFRFSARNCRKI